MSYLFKKIRYPVKKAGPDAALRLTVLRELRRFLDRKEPELVYFLVNTWRTQNRAITYKELREAILSGDIDWDLLQEWQQDYTAFVRDHLHPAWIEAMRAATRRMEEKYPDWYFDPMGEGVRDWTTERSAKFVTEVTQTQIEGIRAVVQRASVLEDMTVDQLARAIRPMVGLTHPQAVANMRYYERLIENGASEKKALDLSVRYAARQHRYRGYNIARTELAFAYNQGSYLGTKQAQEKGYMGDVVKIWSTADDERVCKICGALEGTTIGIDEEFNFNTRIATPADPTIKLVPPAHPSCRCAVMYKEISPPIIRVSMETT
jgi:SPP1 gp7 family putative phage head morphogenesis protein